jgi:cation-transporting ATPase I
MDASHGHRGRHVWGGHGRVHCDGHAGLEPLLRSQAEIAAQLLGVVIGLAARRPSGAERPGIVLAMLLRTVESVPGLRERLEQALGADTLALILRFGEGVDLALLRGLAGPLVSLIEQAQLLQFRFGADCAHHRGHTRDSGERPLPLPDGVIERYARLASLATLGAFGFAVVATQDLEGSAAAVLSGLPRPAVLGRRVFAVELGRRLAAMGALLRDAAALERLDRIDCVLIDASLFRPSAVADLEAAVRAAGLRLVMAADPADGSIAALRSLQAEGHAVLVVAGPDLPALAAADLGVGVLAQGRPPPRHAHVIAADGLQPLWLLLPACAAARRCADQCVQVSRLEVVVGLALCLDGVDRDTVAAVNQATHLLALIAMGNALRLAGTLDSRPPQAPADTVPWHALDVDEVLERLGADASGHGGASRPQATAPKAQHPPWGDLVRLLRDEFNNPLVPVLTAGAALSALLSSPVDAALILGVLGFNAVIGASQRRRVEQAVAALQQRSAAPAWVKRHGKVERLDSQRLVVGDVVVLQAGEVVPADARILDSTGLQVDEATLTGESFPVSKSRDACDAQALADRCSMVYAGTTVVSGTAVAVVVAVGQATEARRPLEAVRGLAGGSGVEARLQSLTALTVPIAAGSGLALLLSALARQQDLRGALSEGVALAVAAVPEGLPILATLAQLAAAGRLSTDNVLVRNPRAIESLGRVNVICLDKTGTLTSGRIELVEVSDAERTMAVGQLDRAGFRTLRVALWATPTPEAGRALPHPTDRGLVEGARRAAVNGEGWERVATLPFEPSRGYHASLGRRKGRCLLCVKGSPETVLAASTRVRLPWGPVPLDAENRGRLEAMAHDLAQRGLRVLAVARRLVVDAHTLADEQVCDLEFVGFLGLADPIRGSAREALQNLRRAGIAVKIITGDHPVTARAIAAELGLATDGPVLTGPMLEAMDDGALAEAVNGATVCARVTSMQKLRLVKALQQSGKQVAMTGDGANDAPAIRLAEVGIALGSHATEAARSAADIVVTDGRLETIVRAVLEGRALWRSVRDAVAMLVGGNLGEIGFTLFGGLSDGRSPLNTRQLLLLNLVTDVAPALTIALRPPGNLDPDALLREGPEASLGEALEHDILQTAAVTAMTGSLARLLAGLTGHHRPVADTVGLLTLVGTQLGQGLVTRRVDPLTVAAGLGSMAALVATVQTPLVSEAFGCRPLGPLALLQAGAATALGIGVGAVLTLDRRRVG